MEGLAVDKVDAPEAQGLAPEVELLDAVERRPHDHVPLGHGLRGAPSLTQSRFQPFPGLGSQLVHALVRALDVGLLGLKLRV